MTITDLRARSRAPLRPLARLLLAAAVTAGAGLAGCRREAAPPPREFDGQAAFRYAERQMSFGPRIPGTDGHRRMAEWLEQELRGKADTLIVQRWTHVTRQGDSLPLVNFVARFNPHASERILYLAHWDTRPRSTEVKTSADSLKPVPGANDGASGVAVLLALADVLKKTPPAIGVDLLFDDGEDYGLFEGEKEDVLIGARYYANHLPPGGAPKFAVLWDMVGDRNLQLFQEQNSLLAAPDVVQLVWGTAEQLGYRTYFIPQPKWSVIDDHVELQKVGIPAIDVLDFDYPWWHTPDDTIDKISAQSLQIVGDVAAAVIRKQGGK
ncbi:MAG TPA: M28 family peptidase [Gemmatimonadales bacterium]|nr:M28 family peptidase [Gemmatimonadales bacterium]